MYEKMPHRALVLVRADDVYVGMFGESPCRKQPNPDGQPDANQHAHIH
jgi:hypothetical protein